MQIHLAMQFAEALSKFGPKEEIAAALVLQFKDEEFYAWGVADVLDAAERIEVELSIGEARDLFEQIIEDYKFGGGGISETVIENRIYDFADERDDNIEENDNE